MTATRRQHTESQDVLYMGFDLGANSWHLAFAAKLGDKPRWRRVEARDMKGLLREIAAAKKRFGLDPKARVCSVYEAGRDGFWLHRYLLEQGIDNLVVDPASIEVDRRQRRAKTDRLDAGKLVSMLLRYAGGEEKVWRVLRAPSEEDEMRRQLHRELEQLKRERTGHVNRIRGLLATCGVTIVGVNGDFGEELEQLRQWNGEPLAEELQQRLLREWQRWSLVQEQIEQLQGERVQQVVEGDGKVIEEVRKLLSLKAIGINCAWLLEMELFAWRDIKNRRELAGLVGLTPTPYASGESCREQGISKAGNRRVRALLIEISWGWLRYQPHSALSRWFAKRFGAGGKRSRRVGIVALARKLLVALWRYLRTGEVPEGAILVDWQSKVSGRRPGLIGG